MVLEERVVEIKNDDFLPFPKLRVDVIDCGHGGRDILDVLVDGVEVHDKSTIVLRELVKWFVSSTSLSGQERRTNGLYLDSVLLGDPEDTLCCEVIAEFLHYTFEAVVVTGYVDLSSLRSLL